MSIVITDLDAEDGDDVGCYMLSVNKNTLLTFSHNRVGGDLAQCLRDAAEAVDREEVRRRKAKGAQIGDLNDYLSGRSRAWR